MSTQSITTLMLDLTAETASGEGSLIDTTQTLLADKNVRPVRVKPGLISAAALFTMSVTAHTGTDMDVTVVAEVDGVDHEIGTFASNTGTGVSSVVIDFCPDIVKIKYVENAMTDWDVKVHCVRL